MNATVFDDDRIRRELTASKALEWTEEALRRRTAGQLVSPPRVRADLAQGSVVFTVGSSGSNWFGYRAYDTLDTTEGEQVVVAHYRPTGNVAAVAIGNELGIRRTGALGGVAAKYLTGSSVSTVGVIGTGNQARAQVWALGGFTTPQAVRVYSRTPSARTAFARDMTTGARCLVTATDSAQAAVDGADLVILATNSGTPTIETGWLQDDVCVVTLGPKQVGRAEFAPELVTDADFVVTDSPAQLASYEPPALVAGMAHDMHDLAELVAGEVTAPLSGRRVFCSVGLAGTEVHLLGRLAQASE